MSCFLQWSSSIYPNLFSDDKLGVIGIFLWDLTLSRCYLNKISAQLSRQESLPGLRSVQCFSVRSHNPYVCGRVRHAPTCLMFRVAPRRQVPFPGNYGPRQTYRARSGKCNPGWSTGGAYGRLFALQCYQSLVFAKVSWCSWWALLSTCDLSYRTAHMLYSLQCF